MVLLSELVWRAQLECLRRDRSGRRGAGGATTQVDQGETQTVPEDMTAGWMAPCGTLHERSAGEAVRDDAAAPGFEHAARYWSLLT